MHAENCNTPFLVGITLCSKSEMAGMLPIPVHFMLLCCFQFPYVGVYFLFSFYLLFILFLMAAVYIVACSGFNFWQVWLMANLYLYSLRHTLTIIHHILSHRCYFPSVIIYFSMKSTPIHSGQSITCIVFSFCCCFCSFEKCMLKDNLNITI